MASKQKWSLNLLSEANEVLLCLHVDFFHVRHGVQAEWMVHNSAEIPRGFTGFEALEDSISDPLIMRAQDLSTILPVDFVTVIFLRVVGSSHHDTTGSFEVTHTKGDIWGWVDITEQVDLPASKSEDVGSDIGPFLAIVASVIANNEAFGFEVCMVIRKIFQKTL